MWKKAREIGVKRRRVRVVRLGEVSSRLGKVGVWEKKMEKILDHTLEGKETFPPIWERKYVKGKKEKEKQEEGFLMTVTWFNNLLMTDKTSFRIRLFRRFRIRLNCARELRRRGTRGFTEIRTNYDRTNYSL